MIRWTPSPRDGCIAIAFDVPCSATCRAKKNFRRNIVPHGKNWRNMRVYKLGRFNTIALLPQLSNQSPLTHEPFTCQPPHCHVAPSGSLLGPVCLAMRSRHLGVTSAPPERRVGSRGSATWPCVPCRIRVAPACHVSSRMPRQLSWSCEN